MTPPAYLKATSGGVYPDMRCQKVAFPRLKDARRAMNTNRNRGLVAHGGGRMEFYKCQFCGEYHAGHQKIGGSAK